MKDTDKATVSQFWDRKLLGREVFCHATLLKDVEMRIWNGNHPVEPNITKTIARKGTRVLVTMFSRFEDVGIRARDIDEIEHGYDARVELDDLEDYEPKWDPDQPGTIELLKKLKDLRKKKIDG